jgi:serine/threonine protein kinase
LTIITKKLGKMSEEDLEFVTSEKAKRFIRKLPSSPPAPLSVQFPNTPSDALDVMKKMLEIHPRKRINVEEALAHPFFGQLHSLEDEPVADTTFDFSFEDEKLHRVRLQELIWREVGHFRPSCLPIAPRRGDTSAERRRDP